jgi:hypothetical protein
MDGVYICALNTLLVYRSAIHYISTKRLGTCLASNISSTTPFVRQLTTDVHLMLVLKDIVVLRDIHSTSIYT